MSSERSVLLRAVRSRSIVLADAILHYSRAFNEYRTIVGRAGEAGWSQEDIYRQVELAANTSEQRAAALREFSEKLRPYENE